MVKVHVKTVCREVPIDEIHSIGQCSFLQEIASNSEEFRGTSADRLRITYNGRILNDEKLKNITNDDAIRVICLPEYHQKNPISDEQRKAVADVTAKWARLWRNGEDRRLHGYSHDFALPEHVGYYIKKFPTLVFDSRLVSVISDWYMFYHYCICDDYKEDGPRNEFKFKNALYAEVVLKIMTTIGSRYGFRFDGSQRAQQSQQPVAQPAITQALLQNALQAALAGFNNPPPPRAAAGGAPVVQVPPAQPAPQPQPQQQRDDPMEGAPNQAENVALLRSFGFENEELIMLALEQSNGDIQQAMEFLIEMNQS